MSKLARIRAGGLLAGLWLMSPAFAQPNSGATAASTAATPAATTQPAKLGTTGLHATPTTAPAHKTSPFHPTKLQGKAQNYYVATWGVDKLRVSSTSSGNLIRFTYRVVDRALAKSLVDRSLTPYLYGQRSHALLEVPVMEKVGPLRQAQGLEEGREYWMVFSNKGQPVKRGDRVNVMIGTFHADGLIVE